jgi:transcription elongation factor SPT5
MLEGRSITIKKGPYRGMRGRVISATATHVRLELEAQMKTVTVDRCAVGTADISYTLT